MRAEKPGGGVSDPFMVIPDDAVAERVDAVSERLLGAVQVLGVSNTELAKHLGTTVKRVGTWREAGRCPESVERKLRAYLRTRLRDIGYEFTEHAKIRRVSDGEILPDGGLLTPKDGVFPYRQSPYWRMQREIVQAVGEFLRERDPVSVDLGYPPSTIRSWIRARRVPNARVLDFLDRLRAIDESRRFDSLLASAESVINCGVGRPRTASDVEEVVSRLLAIAKSSELRNGQVAKEMDVNYATVAAWLRRKSIPTDRIESFAKCLTKLTRHRVRADGYVLVQDRWIDILIDPGPLTQSSTYSMRTNDRLAALCDQYNLNAELIRPEIASSRQITDENADWFRALLFHKANIVTNDFGVALGFRDSEDSQSRVPIEAQDALRHIVELSIRWHLSQVDVTACNQPRYEDESAWHEARETVLSQVKEAIDSAAVDAARSLFSKKSSSNRE